LKTHLLAAVRRFSNAVMVKQLSCIYSAW